MFDWNNLKALLAIAEAGTLSGAGRATTISQPTLSRRLTDLEVEVGAKLFHRRRDGYHLTETGARVREHALQMEAEVRQILNESQARSLPQGNIIITANAGFSAKFLVPLLRKFHETYPKITYEVITSHTLLNVTRRAADIAIRLSDIQSKTLESRLIGDCHFGIYGSREYLELYGEPKTLKDISNHHIIGATGELSTLLQNRLLMKYQGKPPNLLVSDSFTDHISAVRAGFGLATAAAYIGYDDPAIKRVLVEEFNPKIEMWLLAHKDYAFSKRMKLMMNYLEHELTKILEVVE